MSFKPFKWQCPHCRHDQAVTEPHYCLTTQHFWLEAEHALGQISGTFRAITCANQECGKLTLNVIVSHDVYRHGGYEPDQPFLVQQLIPESGAKPQPHYIPEMLREDYTEACRIRDLSPKAAATLIRRCLQGMIRDFCGISKSRLVDEISELKKHINAGTAPAGVSPESVEAIDHVRKVGNIGAHMEKDINLIVPVDPNEAQLLIELVETLFDEWYVARQKRQERFAAIKAIADAKQLAKSATTTSSGGSSS